MSILDEFSERYQIQKNLIPSREFLRLAFSRTGIITGLEKENHPLSVFSIYKSFDRYVANKLKKSTHATAVYSYEDGALETFIEAKKQGFKCFYELPIGYWKSARAIFEEEKSLNPHWSSTIPGLRDSDEKLRRKDNELNLSDFVVVPSKFVESTIIHNYSEKKNISVVPYCSPTDKILKTPNYNKVKLRVLYVDH